MVIDFIPFRFSIDTVVIAGTCLWSLSLYLGLSSFREGIIEGLNRWFNFAERSLYPSQEEFEKTRKARESQNAFYASLFSILPFFIIGAFCNWGVGLSLGQSWSISVGMLACMACGVFELGRRSTQEY